MTFFDFFKNRHSRLWRMAIGLFSFLLFLFFWHGVLGLYEKSAALNVDRQEKEKALSDLTSQEKKVEADTAFLKSGSALEREAKSRLNYKKEGEEVVVIIPEGKKAATATPTSPQSFFGALKNFFASLRDSF